MNRFRNYQIMGKDVVIPGGTTEISDYMHTDNTVIETLVIPEGVTRIGEGAFSGCTSLRSVSIPGSVTEIADFAFEDCTSLTSIRYGGTQGQWAALENDSPVSGVAVQFIND